MHTRERPFASSSKQLRIGTFLLWAANLEREDATALFSIQEFRDNT